MNYDIVLERIKPSKKEHEDALGTYNAIASFIKKAYGNETILVGSVAKDTFLRGDMDLDIFVFFDPYICREELESKGLIIGRGVFEHYDSPARVEYAEHPYLSGTINGIDVEIVPCYKLDAGNTIISAVDRTPFHLKYVLSNLEGRQKDEVRLLKRFLKAQKLYGADSRTNGFSGYLCELLICKYGTFENLVKSALGWDNGKRITFRPANKHFEDPFIVIDPVDASRNVASAVTANTFSLFIDACHRFVETWDVAMFEGPFKGYCPCNPERVVVVEVEAGDIHEDAFFSQARRLSNHIRKVAESYGFSFFRTGIYDNGMIFDMEISTLPLLKKHMGPSVMEYQSVQYFKKKNNATFIEYGKIYSIKDRIFTDIIDVIDDIIKKKSGMGTHFRCANYAIYECKEALELLAEQIVYY